MLIILYSVNVSVRKSKLKITLNVSFILIFRECFCRFGTNELFVIHKLTIQALPRIFFAFLCLISEKLSLVDELKDEIDLI